MKHRWQIEHNSICLAAWKREAAEKTVVVVYEIAAPGEWGVVVDERHAIGVKETKCVVKTEHAGLETAQS